MLQSCKVKVEIVQLPHKQFRVPTVPSSQGSTVHRKKERKKERHYVGC